MIRLVLALVLTAFAPNPALACEACELSDPIAGYPGKTWYDLVKAIVPDLTPEGKGTDTIALRYVEDLGDADGDPVPEGPFVIYNLESRTIEAEGRRLTVVSVNLGPADGWAASIEALALFDEKLELLDATNVGQDNSNWLQGGPIRISARDEALLIQSEHFNSNQTYDSYALLMVKNGKWQTIDTIWTLGDRWCGHERTESLDVASSEAGAGYWPITVTVTDVQRSTEADEECGDEADMPDLTETYSTTYAWSASMGLYFADKDGFEALSAINRDRY